MCVCVCACVCVCVCVCVVCVCVCVCACVCVCVFSFSVLQILTLKDGHGSWKSTKLFLVRSYKTSSLLKYKFATCVYGNEQRIALSIFEYYNNTLFSCSDHFQSCLCFHCRVSPPCPLPNHTTLAV